MRSILLSAVVAVAVVACGGGEKPAPKAEKPAAEEPKKVEAPPAPEAKPEVKAVEVGMDDGGEYAEVMIESDGDQMMYKQTAITIKADTPTRIKMVNNAQSPAMVHNVVIVKKGEGDAVGQAAVTVPATKDHVPEHPGVLAATKLAKPGETSTVVVNLPAGEYEYICTFPGHYVMMKGVLTVE